MVTPDAKRKAVAHACTVHAVSQRRACLALTIDRSTVRYTSTRPDDALSREAMKAVAAERRRFGYCQRAPKFPRMWASKIPYLAGFWFRGSAGFVIGLEPSWRAAAAFGGRRRRDEGLGANMLGNEVGMLPQAIA